MSVKQNTLKAEFSLKGKGLHTGKEVCATFKPAEENCGYRIIRTDIEGRPVSYTHLTLPTTSRV